MTPVSFSTSRLLSGPSVVDIAPQFVGRGSPSRTPPDLTMFSDASKGGWGVHLLVFSGFRTLAPQAPSASHQRIGIVSSPQRPTDLPSSSRRQDCVRPVRQHDGPSLHQERRTDPLQPSTCSGFLFFRLCIARSIHLIPLHILGRLNFLADALSRRNVVPLTE
jgi:hypothetical protein